MRESGAGSIPTFMLTRRQQIITLRMQGLSRRQMAAHLGISLDLVHSYMHQLLKNGIIAPIGQQERRRRQRTAAKRVNVRAARKMRNAGKSYRAIGGHFGVSGFTVAKVIGSTARITPMQRQLMRLHRQGLTYEAIAAHLRKPPGTVSVMLARLVRKGLLPKRSNRNENWPKTISRRSGCPVGIGY